MKTHNGSDYAIGDVQGCFDALQRLLDRIKFDEHADRLWFVGDLVNRGPQSLEVLRFIKNLPLQPRITLGNHDLHLLSLIFTQRTPDSSDKTLQAMLTAPDREELGDWLRNQSVLCHDPSLHVVMCHAGIAPIWSLPKAKELANELEAVLSGEHFRDFLTGMYGSRPDHWSPKLTGMSRLRIICNYFTRMRFCHADGRLALQHKGSIANASSDLHPWYDVPNRVPIEVDIVFGHWAALDGVCPNPHIHAIDTGCVWGRTMTALRLQDRQRTSVPGL
ncbi:MAG: symmetrical bis(5'-nucleosyl)-tetraphosphatase [Legionellaceae bacterium]|nr:symmetrical bis(5'-nucleosyl)-tetraphosphatase [Legionellaceae bacterium]